VGSVTFTAAEASLFELTQTVGAVAAPYRLRICGEGGLQLPAGREGEVQVLSPYAMSGYWRAPEASAAAFSEDGWLRTGDIGVLDPEGRLRLVGRTTEVFKSGGYNIYPAEIEAALLACGEVAEAAVLGLPDSLYGHVGAAAVTLKPGRTVTPGELKQRVSLRLANYKTPKLILVLDELPKLPVGKIDKAGLRKQLEDRLPRTPT
jgi:acyl-CoA synthetase (AMP-forming)/AMP-acid ligase II